MTPPKAVVRSPASGRILGTQRARLYPANVRDPRHTPLRASLPPAGADPLGARGEKVASAVRESEELVTRAIAGSSFAALAPHSLRPLLEAGSLVRVAQRGVAFRSSDRPSRGGLVLSGLVRIFVESADGRRLTVRYARMGALAGIVTGLSRPAPVNVQAVTECQLWELPIGAIEAAARADAAFAWALAQETSLRLLDSIEALADASFGTLAGRLARTLLDVAEESVTGNRLEAAMTNQELADSVGTVREVVARLVGRLREEGVLSTSRGLITIQDPERLAASVGQWSARRA